MTDKPFTEKPTGAMRTVAGMRWACWHIGITQHEWRSDVGKIRHNWNMTGWYAVPAATGRVIRNDSDKTKMFRTFDAAARALVKLAGLTDRVRADLKNPARDI